MLIAAGVPLTVVAHILGHANAQVTATVYAHVLPRATAEALEGMLKRVGTPGIGAFVRAVIQGETLGVSIGTILRNLADQMRKRRKAEAEEKAQKAPVKMLIPMVFCIFPALFVVVLGPAALNIRDAFA